LTRISSSGGNVAFKAQYADGQGFYLAAGGMLTSIVNSGDPAPAGTFPLPGGSSGIAEGAALSGDRVAFVAGYSGQQGVFTGNGGALTTIAKTGDPAPSGTFGQSNAFSQNVISGDMVAFRGVYPGGAGIFTGNGGSLTTIVKTGDPAPSGTFTSLAVGGIASNGDDVSFFGQWAGGTGAFVSDNGTIIPVVKTGDLLFGQPLTSLAMNQNKIGLDPRGRGNVVFSYILANGDSGVAMATPVPEPAAFAFVVPLLSLAVRNRNPARVGR
jgi:hypothetical protein